MLIPLGFLIAALVGSTTTGEPVTLEPIVLPEPRNTGQSEFGGDLAVGDANADGFLDLCVGMAAKDGVGGAWILWGPDFASGLEIPPPPTLERGDAWTLHLLSFVDLDQDGHLDLITRNRDADDPAVDRVWLVRGPAFDTYHEFGQPAAGPSRTLGHYAHVGDLDADGAADIVLSQHLADPQGAVAVYRGALGIETSPQMILAPNETPLSVKWGYGLGLFDLDRDGDADIVTTQVGAVGDRGQLAYFDWNGLAAQPRVLPTPSMKGTRCSVNLVAGIRFIDLNADGIEDILARGGPPYETSSGLAANEDPTFFVAWGPDYATGKCVQHSDRSIGTSNFAFRYDVGDVNRDGAPDLVAGDSYAHLPRFDRIGSTTTDGRVTILYGPDFTTQQTIDSIHPGAGLGHDVKVVDVDGDGFCEIFAGVPGADVVVLYRHDSLRALSPKQLSAAMGGEVLMSIECGELSANENYLVLPSILGPSPWTEFPALGGALGSPLVFNDWASIGIGLVNTSYFQQFQGQLDSEGAGLAQFSVPASAIPTVGAGLQFSFTALTFGISGEVRFATNSLSVTLSP